MSVDKPSMLPTRDETFLAHVFRSNVFILALVFAFCLNVLLCIHVLLSAVVAPTRCTDYIGYYQPVATNVSSGRGLVVSSGEPAVRYPPGHPLFLATLSLAAERAGINKEAVLDGAAVVLHAISATILFWFAGQIWSRKTAWTVAFLWTTYLPAIWLDVLLGSEVPFIPALLLGVLVLWRCPESWLNGLLSGVCFGTAMLCRPIAIGVPLLLALFCLLVNRERTLRLRAVVSGSVLVGTLVVVVPWQVWMYQQTRLVQPLSTGGLPSIVDGLTYARPRTDSEYAKADVSADIQTFMKNVRVAYESHEIGNPGKLVSWILTEDEARGWTVVKLIGVKMVRSWYATDSHRHEKWLLGLQLPYLILATFGVVVFWRQATTSHGLIALSFFLVIYFWFMTTMVLSIVRYMVPAMPFVLLLGAPALEKAFDAVFSRPQKSKQ